VVATDVDTGRAVYHEIPNGDRKDIEWIRASASMPLVSKIVNINGQKLLDGGVADSIPVKFMEKRGMDKMVVILTQPYDYIKKPNEMMPMVRVMFRKYPDMVNAIGERHIRYNETIAYIKRLEKQGKIFVIRPSVDLRIDRLCSDPNEIDRVYKIGRQVAKDRLKNLKNYLAK